MNVLFSNFATAEAMFPQHVRKRVLERFRLFMTKTEQQNVEMFLRKDFATARIDMSRFCMSPFYINASDTANGKNSFIASSKYLNYYGNYDEVRKKLIIKTVFMKKRDIKNLK